MKHIRELIQEALREKWCLGSTKLIAANCNFCFDACRIKKLAKIPDSTSTCDSCRCNPAMCYNHAKSGYIKELLEKYGKQCTIDMLTPQELKKVGDLLSNVPNK